MDELTRSTLTYLRDPSSQPVGDLSLFARLADEKPVLHAGQVWIVSRHDLVRRLATNPGCVVQLPDVWAERSARDPLVARTLESFLPIQPPTDHRRLRRLLASAFSASATNLMTPAVVGIVEELLDHAAADGECDVVSEICGPLPVYTTVALLDLPVADRDHVLGWARSVNALVTREITGRVGGGEADPRTGTGPHAGLGTGELDEVVDYIRDLVARRLAHPGTDLISRLAAEVDGEDGRLSDDELVSVVLMLFMTGIDTVGGGTANVLLALARQSHIWSRIVEDPDLAGPAYTEGLRLHPPLAMMGRIAATDLALDAATTIPAGDTVLLVYGAANLDPRVFDRPLEYRLDRTENPHLSFGRGPHYCLGAALASLQGETLLRGLAARTETLDLTALGPRRTEMAFQSPAELRLRFSSPTRSLLTSGSVR